MQLHFYIAGNHTERTHLDTGVGSGSEESSAVTALVSGAWPNPNNVDPKQQIAKTAVTAKQV